LLDIFGDVVEVSPKTLQDMTMDLISEQDVVVLSKEVLIGITRPFIPPSCPIIIANREVNLVQTQELLKLPAKQRILVINDTVEHAVETTKSLSDIYYEHEYIAYDPINLIPENIDWLVTPGEMELVPKEFTNVIDIGQRILDFNTVLELASILDDSRTRISLMNRFFKSQLSLAQKTRVKDEQYGEKTLFPQPNTHTFDDEKLELSEEKITSMIEKIEMHGFLEESLAILSVYNEGRKNFQSFGRAKVKSELQKFKINLTDQQLRLRLEVLQELNLVNVRKGRAGTKLSDKGEVFLLHHESQ